MNSLSKQIKITLILIFLFIAVIFLYWQDYFISDSENITICQIDSDCELVDDISCCCPYSIAINKNYKELISRQRSDRCKQAICPAELCSSDPYNPSVACLNNKCIKKSQNIKIKIEDINLSTQTITLRNDDYYIMDVDSVKYIERRYVSMEDPETNVKVGKCPDKIILQNESFVCKIRLPCSGNVIIAVTSASTESIECI